MDEQQRQQNAHNAFVNFPLGLSIQGWADGLMISVLDPITRVGHTAYLGHDGCLRLVAFMQSLGILGAEGGDTIRGDVLVEWPGPKPDAEG